MPLKKKWPDGKAWGAFWFVLIHIFRHTWQAYHVEIVKHTGSYEAKKPRRSFDVKITNQRSSAQYILNWLHDHQDMWQIQFPKAVTVYDTFKGNSKVQKFAGALLYYFLAHQKKHGMLSQFYLPSVEHLYLTEHQT
jgi:cystathionine beta-lyase/cystathionine gamma-synthase